MRDRRDPSWYGSGRALLFRPGPGTGEAVAVNRVGRGESDNQGWFSYDDGTELEQGQISRAGDRLAAVAGGDEIHLFGVADPPPALPVLRCVIPGGPFANPTWSPDGTMLAWEAPDGVHVGGPIPDLRGPVDDCSVIRERRLGAGSRAVLGRRPTCPARRRRAPVLGHAGRAPPGARVQRAARGAAPARARGAGDAADRARAGAGRGAAVARRPPRGRVLRRRARAGTLRLRVPLDRAGAAGAGAARAARAAAADHRAGARAARPRAPAGASCCTFVKRRLAPVRSRPRPRADMARRDPAAPRGSAARRSSRRLPVSRRPGFRCDDRPGNPGAPGRQTDSPEVGACPSPERCSPRPSPHWRRCSSAAPGRPPRRRAARRSRSRSR